MLKRLEASIAQMADDFGRQLQKAHELDKANTRAQMAKDVVAFSKLQNKDLNTLDRSQLLAEIEALGGDVEGLHSLRQFRQYLKVLRAKSC